MIHPITWSVSGADGGKFNISTDGTDGTDGVLTFKVKPDYENPTDANGDSDYEVTVVATDSLGNRGTKAVTVEVPNKDEPGVVTLSRTQPRVGVPVTASLTDPDGNISGVKWQWYTGAIDENNNAIEDETSDTYTPTEADVTAPTVTLMVRASYTDGHDAMKMADGAAIHCGRGGHPEQAAGVCRPGQ